MRQGITTRHLGPTNSKGSRIKATATGGTTITLPWDSDLNVEANHTRVVQALATRNKWAGLWCGGADLGNGGYHYVNVSDGRLGPALCGIDGQDWFFVDED